MNPADAVPIALLLLFGVAVGIGGVVLLLAWRWHRQSPPHFSLGSGGFGGHALTSCRLSPLVSRPTAWLAIRSRDPARVLDALSISDPTPGSWTDALTGENRLFITPSIRGWVLVVGTAVPNPADDVDVCFRFLRVMSRKLGEVQFFCADRVLHHHAWARIEAGRVIRAYAWAGTTLWNQGMKTAAESALDLKTFGYAAEPLTHWARSEFLAANVERVPSLAARWSLDPAEIEVRLSTHAPGLAGRSSVRY